MNIVNGSTAPPGPPSCCAKTRFAVIQLKLNVLPLVRAGHHPGGVDYRVPLFATQKLCAKQKRPELRLSFGSNPRKTGHQAATAVPPLLLTMQGQLEGCWNLTQKPIVGPCVVASADNHKILRNKGQGRVGGVGVAGRRRCSVA